MLINDVRMATLAKALVDAVNKGPPPGVGEELSADFIRGTQRGVLMTVLPLLLLASDDRINLDEFATAAMTTLPLTIRTSLTGMVTQMRLMLADDPCPEELSPEKQRVLTFRFMDTLKVTFEALFAATGTDRSDVAKGTFAAISAIIYALSDRFDIPMEELCESLAVPGPLRAPMLSARDHTKAIFQAEQA